MRRRGFLKAMGAAFASAPVALAPSAAKLAGLNGGIEGVSLATVAGVPQCLPTGTANKLLEYITLNGIPKWKKDEITRQSSWIQALDTDLAASRSMSLSARLIIQKERNTARALEGYRWRVMQAALIENLGDGSVAQAFRHFW